MKLHHSFLPFGRLQGQLPTTNAKAKSRSPRRSCPCIDGSCLDVVLSACFRLPARTELAVGAASLLSCRAVHLQSHQLCVVSRWPHAQHRTKPSQLVLAYHTCSPKLVNASAREQVGSILDAQHPSMSRSLSARPWEVPTPASRKHLLQATTMQLRVFVVPRHRHCFSTPRILPLG